MMSVALPRPMIWQGQILENADTYDFMGSFEFFFA